MNIYCHSYTGDDHTLSAQTESARIYDRKYGTQIQRTKMNKATTGVS